MNCRVCKSSKLNHILSLGDQYLSEFRDDDIKPPRAPLTLTICDECKQVQLEDTVSQNLLYTDNYGYRSGINATMRNHLGSLALELQEFVGFNAGDTVVDIGSNDGTLLKSFFPFWRRVGYDLVPKFGRDYISNQIEFVNKPFTKYNFRDKAKIITAISVFYDFDDPMAVMRDMAERLAEKGIIVIQQNYLLSMLLNNAFDNCCHEHICYHSVQSMSKIVESFGLQIFDVKINDLNGGSFRIYACRKGDYPVTKWVRIQRNIEIENELKYLGTYEAFGLRIKGIKDKLHKFIVARYYNNESVYAYGASTRGNTLLQYCELDNKLIQKAVERNPEKFGKKISSLGIPIISEEQARKEHPDYFLILPWFFASEIRDREAEYLKTSGKLIFPLPKVEVISK